MSQIAQTIPALNVEDLRQKLRQGPTKFTFVKKTGELRFALGTLNLNIIPTGSQPKGVRPASPKVIAFFDLEKIAWRSVSVDSLIFG
jgi:hypothetical protein